ncbi:MAG: hypothetical protein HXS50_02310 [Theionarchaea archaeon]|nr:hypothetical protein [Theionarchaea archaeon]
MFEVYGALEGAADFATKLWDNFMGFDSEVLLLSGIIIGFALALALGLIAQYSRNPVRQPKSQDNFVGSMGQSQNMCA